MSKGNQDFRHCSSYREGTKPPLSSHQEKRGFDKLSAEERNTDVKCCSNYNEKYIRPLAVGTLSDKVTERAAASHQLANFL